MPFAVCLAALFFSWVGHAFIWTTVLNYLYARPYPKGLLRIWRAGTGLFVLGYPLLLASAVNLDGSPELVNSDWGRAWAAYAVLCLTFGGLVYPAINVHRLLRKPPACLHSESTHTLDLGKELGPDAIGNGKGRHFARMPFNDIFRVDFTEMVLALPNLPPEWNGLTILHLTDVHYHGTPSRAFHQRVMDEIERRWPENDLVCLTGDYVDTDEHRSWIGPLLGRFRGREGSFAILGNHDRNHEPDAVRKALAEAGYTVIGNGWKEVSIRGVSSVIAGHEGPWFAPPPDLANAPIRFRLCLSHTPDNFYWGVANGIDLMLCGHVHGGQIRLPLIQSIFVPSVYGRRFDMGVFEKAGATMVVGRGLSGKEPLRFRCRPQVIRLTLVSIR